MRMIRRISTLLLISLMAVGMTMATPQPETKHGNNPGISELELVNLLLADDGYALLVTIDPSIDVLPGILGGANPLSECVDAALLTCGAGQVCGVCVSNGSCSFACRDSEGGCDHWPGCDAAADP